MHPKSNAAHHLQRQIAQFLFFASPFTLPYITIALGASTHLDLPDKLHLANLFGLVYIAKLFFYGIPLLFFGIIPVLLGIALLVFYRVQSRRRTKRAMWGWSGSILFNLMGPVAVATALFDEHPWWSIEMPVYLWASLNVILSSIALWHCLTERRNI